MQSSPSVCGFFLVSSLCCLCVPWILLNFFLLSSSDIEQQEKLVDNIWKIKQCLVHSPQLLTYLLWYAGAREVFLEKQVMAEILGPNYNLNPKWSSLFRHAMLFNHFKDTNDGAHDRDALWIIEGARTAQLHPRNLLKAASNHIHTR